MNATPFQEEEGSSTILSGLAPKAKKVFLPVITAHGRELGRFSQSTGLVSYSFWLALEDRGRSGFQPGRRRCCWRCWKSAAKEFGDQDALRVCAVAVLKIKEPRRFWSSLGPWFQLFEPVQKAHGVLAIGKGLAGRNCAGGD